MATFSCPYCLKVIEYTPPPNSRIIWVEKWMYTIDARDKARKLEREFDIPRVEHIHISCPHCNNKMSVFFSLNLKPEKENITPTDPEDFSMEIE